MQRTYRCHSCGVSFLAEESPRVVCPHCQSDDTEPEKVNSSMKKTVIIAVCAFVLALSVGILAGYIKKNSEGANSQEADTPASESYEEKRPTANSGTVEIPETEVAESVDSVVDSVYVGEEPDGGFEFENTQTEEVAGGGNPFVMAELELTSFVQPAANGTYSFSITVSRLPEGAKVRYELLSVPGGKVVKRSSDGRFSGVAGTETGVYNVKAIMSYEGQTKEITRELSGFKKAKVEAPKEEKKADAKVEPAKLPAAEKLTTGQVQALIDKVVSSGSTRALTTAKGIVNNVRVDFESVDGESFPSGISAIINNINTMDVKGYRVVSVDYDAQNKVNHIRLRPIL